MLKTPPYIHKVKPNQFESFSLLQMFLADDYELQGLCKGHCPFCRTSIDSL